MPLAPSLRVATLLLVLPLTSCGNSEAPAAAQLVPAPEPVPAQRTAPADPADAPRLESMAQGGDITLRIASAQAGKSAAGLTTCEIEFEVANEMAEPIKFLAAFWRPIVVEGNVTMHNAIDARGDQRLYAGKVPPGEVKGRTGKVDGVDCKFITGIRLWDVTCGLDSRADCKDRVSVENHSQLALNP